MSLWRPKDKVPVLPGLVQSENMSPELQGLILTQGEGDRIGKKEIAEASEILKKYKTGKAELEARIVEDEQWWELRHWEVIRRKGARPNWLAGYPMGAPWPNEEAIPSPEPSSAWLFNAILNKHADAMDNYPEPVVLPREKSDEESAKILSSVLPVVMEYNDFEKTYSQAWWEKLKHGTAAYGVFWNSEKENGLGDIDIQEIDLLKLFWEPGVTDIQDSRNLFIVDMVDTDLLEEQYPEYKGKLGGHTIDVKQYVYNPNVDTEEKSVVVDWYYKVKAPSGKTILHYAKFCGDCLLYATENDPNLQDTGLYEHGEYPVVLDVMFPEKGTPIGFGYVAICKDPQLYIDKLSANILESSMMATKKRFFASKSAGINIQQFLDWNSPIVEVEGSISDERLREITVEPINSNYANVVQMKIEELKETAANRDVNSGGAGGGITAASAIAALQEAGNKASRDMISASYRAHTEISSLVIELIRQFYDEMRSFRITGELPGQYEFVDISNQSLQDQYLGEDAQGIPLYRRPVFDLKIKAQKKNPFSRMEQNERAMELYNMGFFNPERAQEASGALEMMDFEGIDKVKEQVQQGQTLMNMLQQMSQQMDQMAMLLQAYTGKDMGIESPVMPSAGQPAQAGPNRPITDGIMQAQGPRSDYTRNLLKRTSVMDGAK